MKKLKKFLLIFFAVFAVVIIGGLVYVKIKYPPEKVKAILISKMSEFLRREIEIKNVSVGLTGLKVEGLRISERPAFTKGSFVEARQFVIKPNFAALLKKEISINKIILVSPVINITRYKDNSFNFSDLIAAQSTAPAKVEKTEKPEKMQALPVAFIVSKFAVTGGDVKFTDKTPQGLSAEIKNINVSFSGISLVKPFLADMSMDILQKNMSGYISLKSAVDIKNQKLKIKEALVLLNGAGIKISGDVEGFLEPEKMSFDVRIRDEKLQIEKITKSFPVNKDLAVSGSADIDAVVSGTMSKISAKGKIDLKNTDVSFADMFKKPKSMPAFLSADVSVENMDGIKINDISAVVDAVKISAAGQVSGISKNQIRPDVKITLEKFDLKTLAAIIPMTKDFGLSGSVSSGLKVSGDLKLLSVLANIGVENVQSVQKDMSAKINKMDFGCSAKFDLSAKGGSSSGGKKGDISFNLAGGSFEIKMPEKPAPPASASKTAPAVTEKKQSVKIGIPVPPGFSLAGEVKIKSIIFNGYKISDCFTKINFADALLTVKPFSMSMCGGSIAGALSADLSKMDPEKIKFSFEGSVRNYDLHELLLETGKKLQAQVWGIANADMKITGTGADMSGLNGAGSAQIKNVKAAGGNMLKALSVALAVARVPEINDASFKTITSKINIVNGRLDLSNTKTDGGDKLDAYCSGNANLAALTQDIKGEIKFTKAYSGGDLAKYTADSEGRVTVPFTVGGTFDNPKVSLDWNKLAKTAAANETKRILMKEGEKLLKGLFSR